MAEGRTAASPYRPWRGGSGDVHAVYKDFAWVSGGTVTPVTPRSQATTSLSTTQFKTEDIQAAGQEAVQIMEEVRAATRFPRRSSVGFLNKDEVPYAGLTEKVELFEMSGTGVAEGIAHYHPAPGYTISARVRNATALKIVWATQPGYTYFVRFTAIIFPATWLTISEDFVGDGSKGTYYATIGASSGFFSVGYFATGDPNQTLLGTVPSTTSVVSISMPLQTSFDPTSNGTLIRFSDGVFFNGTYNLAEHYYRFEAVKNGDFIAAQGLAVDAYWAATDTEVVRSDPNRVPQTQVFAAFGDNSNDNNAYRVGTMVATWQPEFLLMLGDHNYTGNAAQYVNENRPFLPWINDGKVLAVPGNHDLDIQNGAAFYNFFKQDQRFYSRRIGNVEVFAIDDGINTPENSIYPGGSGQLCPAAKWLKEALSASQAPWKVVTLHHDPYISPNTGHTHYDKVKWPFKDWGADVVMFGHVHAYEHMLVAHAERGNNGIHMLCIGFGGHDLKQFNGGPQFGSIYRFPISPVTPVAGASRFTVTATTFKWDTYTIDGVLRETYTLTKLPDGTIYQARPEDEAGIEGHYETFDEVPWRRDLVGNGELVEVVNHTPPVVRDVLLTGVSSKIAIKDQTGADYTVHGLTRR